ncbi:MAG TPA: choice-of-anchor L domain-containing protein, partial [Solirubrobacterales bacterium]|nr:choice-of-anchor L domain-containing protein [Solirubrobacterales bacterium]
MPTSGSTFAVLTNGDVTLADPPNDSSAVYTDNGTSYGGANDVTTLKVNVDVPSGANCLSVDGVFYSEEYPEFVGIQWNDAFIAELGSSTWSYSELANDVTAPNNFAFDEDGHLMEVNTVEFTNEDTGLEYDGSSRLLTAATPITSGPHNLYFSIYDAGDHNVDSAVFLDNLRTSQSSDCASGAVKADSDGDGLTDRWEEEGYDANGDGQVDVDLPAMGADPEHKDLFVQLDAMKGLRMSSAAIAKVTAAFANSPVPNPDDSAGVTLHVDNGAGSVMDPKTGATWGSLSRASDLNLIPSLGFFHEDGSYDWSAFDSIKQNRFPSVREPIFHYALSVDRYGGSTSSGISRGI